MSAENFISSQDDTHIELIFSPHCVQYEKSSPVTSMRAFGNAASKHGEGLRGRGRLLPMFSPSPSLIDPTNLETHHCYHGVTGKKDATGKTFFGGQWAQLRLLPGWKDTGQEGGRRWQNIQAVRTHTHSHTHSHASFKADTSEKNKRSLAKKTSLHTFMKGSGRHGFGIQLTPTTILILKLKSILN